MRVTSSYLLLPALLLAAPVAAQSVKTVTLAGGKEFPESFGRITQAGELKDGRVILADSVESKLQLLDFAKGSHAAISRTGEGPKEYKMPGVLFMTAPDTVVFFDFMQRRLLLISQAGAAIRTAPYGDPGNPMAMATGMIPMAMDATGRLWGQTTGMKMDGVQEGKMPTFADTVEIQSFDRKGNRFTTALRIVNPAKQVAPKMEFGDGAFRITLTAPDYRPTDVWTVLPDGRVALFRGGVYRARFLTPGKPEVLGPIIPATPVPVTAAEKKALVDSLRTVMDSQMAVMKRNIAAQGGQQIKTEAKVLEPASWAATKPPVNAALASPDGRLWVQTAAPHTLKGQRFDLLNGATGALIGKVVVPAGERVVGFGRGAVYTVRKDEDDLEYLRRYTLPAFP